MAKNGSDAFERIESYLIGYYALILIIIGTLFNGLTFFIFCRKKFRNGNEKSVIHYMRAIAIVDILMLYGWNLDHYLVNIYGFDVRSTMISACKFILFLNYVAPQLSAWLRVMICLDRYLSLSRLHRTCFSRSKNVLIIIGFLSIFFILFNGHFLIFACFRDVDGTINSNAKIYKIFPLWDWINLGLYNGLPSICMIVLNSGVIYHLIRLKRKRTIQKSRIQHRSISITLLLTTILFMIFTIPPTLSYGFFYSQINPLVLHCLDALMYTYHISSFPLYLFTFDPFRQEFLRI